MAALVERWSNINSHTKNCAGIEKLIEEVKKAFQILDPDEIDTVHFAQSKGLFLKKRAQSPIQIYFGGHLDTVFPIDHPFQKAVYLNENTLQGPGVTDMKGGLVVMLKALECFEKKERASTIGWNIFLNTDEEIGSPESTSFIERCAQKCHLACIFEPALEDGSLVSKRKGSSNYRIISQGKAAHAGRNPKEGKNAIFPLAHFIAQVEGVNASSTEALVNIGIIEGGKAPNIIPDYAECYLNVRSDNIESMQHIENKLKQLAAGYGLSITRLTFRPPKPFDQKTKALFEALKGCADQLEFALTWKESGGVCDGNILASQGVPTIDSLGACGGKIHTEKEYLHLPSLCEKTQLTVLFLSEIASGNIKIKDL